MDLTKQILSELRKYLEPVNEDVADQSIIYIDCMPGKPRPDMESFIVVSADDMATRRILRDVTGNDTGGGGEGYEFLSHAGTGAQHENGHLMTAPTDEEGFLAVEPPQFLPDYSAYPTSYTIQKLRKQIQELRVQAEFAQLSGSQDPAHQKRLQELTGELQRRGLKPEWTKDTQAALAKAVEDLKNANAAVKVGSLKTPWMLFMDWFMLSLRNAGLEPLRHKGFDAQAADGSKINPQSAKERGIDLDMVGKYGLAGVEPHLRYGQVRTPYTGMVQQINAAPSIHDTEMTDADRERLKAYGGKGERSLEHIPFIDRLRYANWAERNAPPETPGPRRARGVSETRDDPSTTIPDDITSIIIVVNSLGTEPAEICAKLLKILQAAPPPKWMKLAHWGDSEIFVQTSQRQAGYSVGGPTAGADADPAAKGKITLPDQDYDPAKKKLVDVGPGAEIDSDAVIAKHGGDSTAAGQEIAQSVRRWARSGSGGQAKHKARVAHSQTAHATMADTRGRAKEAWVRILVNGGVMRGENGEEVQVKGIMAAASEYGYEPYDVKMAITKYLNNAGVGVDIDDPEQFMSMTDDEKNKVITLLKQAETNFLLELSGLVEAVSRWTSAISEGDTAAIAAARRGIDEAVSRLLPYPIDDIQREVTTLLRFKKRGALAREFMRDNPDVYAAALALRGFDAKRIFRVLSEQGVCTQFGSAQLGLIKQLSTTLTEGELGACVARANTILNTVQRVDRPLMVFKSIVHSFGRPDLRHLRAIAPQPVINADGYLRDQSLEDALKPAGVAMDSLSKSTNRGIISESLWSQYDRYLQLRSA